MSNESQPEELLIKVEKQKTTDRQKIMELYAKIASLLEKRPLNLPLIQR